MATPAAAPCCRSKPVTGVPIKFIGTGEHLDALEEFHPERMAGRILGMGDVLTLVEAGPAEVRPGRDGPQEAELRKGEFTLDTFARCSGRRASWARWARSWA